MRRMLENLKQCQEALEDCHTALGESDARYRTLMENAPDAIVVLDLDQQRFVDANRNAVRLFELLRAALLTSNPIALSPPTQACGAPSPELATKRLNEALEGATPRFE